MSFSLENMARRLLDAPRAATQELISPIHRTPEEIQRMVERDQGSQSFGGTVTTNLALSIATVYACVRLLSDSISMLPLTLYRRDGAELVADLESPLGKILAFAPTPLLSPYEFWRMAVCHLLMRGNFYAQKVGLGGKIDYLLPLIPDYMTPKMVDSATITYEYAQPNKPKVTYKQGEIFHIRNLCIDGSIGISPLKMASNAARVAILGESHAGNMLQNGARPSGGFQMENELSDEAYKRLREDLDDKYSGSHNSGRPMLLEGGLKFQPFQMTAEDSQFMESRAFQRGEICIFFGVPPQLIGDVDKGTSWGTGVEQQNLSFLTHVLKPYLVNIQQAILRSLVAEKDRADYVAKFDTSELTKADFVSRQNGYQVQRRNGVISANEWRKAEGLDPIKDEVADEYLIDQTLVADPLNSEGDAAASEPNSAQENSGSGDATAQRIKPRLVSSSAR